MRRATAVVVLAVSFAASGCGGSSRPAAGSLAADTAVVRGWSAALRAGQVERAAGYFALPSVVQLEPGGPLGTIRTRADARLFDTLLPCGASLISARRVGRFIDALFLLTTRPGMPCNGIGFTARTAFEIAGGRIAQWRRVANEPGDSRFARPQSTPGPGPTPAPGPAGPAGPQSPTQSI